MRRYRISHPRRKRRSMEFTLLDTSTRRSGGWRSIGWNRSKIGKIASRVIGSNVLHRLLILTAATITVEIFTIRLAGFWNHLYKRLCYDASLGSTDSNFKLRSWRTNFLIIVLLVSRLLKMSENVFDEIKLLQFIFDIEM